MMHIKKIRTLFAFQKYTRIHPKLFEKVNLVRMCKKIIEFFIALMHNLCLKGKIIDQNQEKNFESRRAGAGKLGRGPGNSNRP